VVDSNAGAVRPLLHLQSRHGHFPGGILEHGHAAAAAACAECVDEVFASVSNAEQVICTAELCEVGPNAGTAVRFGDHDSGVEHLGGGPNLGVFEPPIGKFRVVCDI